MANLNTSPIPPAQLQQLLFVKRAADMTLTSDQVMTKMFSGTSYVMTNVVGVRKTGAFGTACLGGIYDTASKAGNAMVAATQTWAGLTGAGTIQTATLAAVASTLASTATLILSNTTGNTGALTADIFVFGFVID